MSEKHKHKDKKRKDDADDDDKEAKRAKHKKHEDDSDDEKKVKADHKHKKEKDKDKKKEKKDKEKEKAKDSAGQAGARTDLPKGAMGVPTPVGTPVPVPMPAAPSKFSDKPPETENKQDLPPEKMLKSWQDDELEVESGDESSAPTKLQTLSSVAARSLGQGPAEASAKAQDVDSLDAFMADNAKERHQQQKEKSKEASGSDAAPSGMAEGMSVMDSSRVKTISLEEITALISGGATTSSSSSSSKPQEEAKQDTSKTASAAAVAGATEEAKQDTSKTASDAAVAGEAGGADAGDDDDDTFHAAFMAQMRKIRGEAAVADVEDGSDTGEEWDEDRKEREKRRQEKREARWKAQEEKAIARRKAREARRAEDGEQDDGEDDDSEDSIDDKPSQDAASSLDPKSQVMTKKEKRRIRREQKLKEQADKEEEAKRLKKMPTGMKEEERLESDPEASEDSEMEKPAESYFDLVKRFTTKKSLPQVDHSTIDYKSFTKNLYVQVKEITSMREHEVEDCRRTNGEIHVRGKNCPRPIKSFLQCGLPEKILKLLEKRDCEIPFPIQMQAIPALMCGRDMIGVAQTGSGKTLAYLLPLMRHALAQMPTRSSDDGPVGFIVAPTRELALQIQRECNVFCKAVNMTSVCAFGGGPMGEQLSALKKGCEILVGTPGRLIDVLTTSNGKITNLRHVSFLVLDEADRMFDMGFEPQIGMFLQATRPDKQVALLSATLPTHVEALARQCLKKPIEITVGERNTAAANVTQYVEVLDETQKFYRLLQLLGEWHDHGSVIIFVHQQKEVDEMFTELLKFGYPALALHGGQDQADRDFTLQDFKDGVANILVATSVAARGLDVKKVILVVNFKVPDHLEDYIHRIGRTGRAGKAGFAFTFIQPDEGDRAQDMLDALRQCGQEVPEKLKRLTEEFQSQINRGEAKKRRRWGGFGGKGFKYDNSERSRQQKDRLKAKQDGLIGDDNGSEEEEVKDAWDEDKPLAASARKKQDEKKEEPPKPKPKAEVSPKTTGEAAVQIAERLKAEEEAKAQKLLGNAPAGSPAADNGHQSDGLVPPSAVPGVSGAAKAGGAPEVVKKTDEDFDAEAQAKAEDVLKNLSEELREQKLPKLKEKIKAQLIQASEKAATASGQPGPPKPPPPPVEQSPLMKATAVVPGVLGAPTVIGIPGEQSIVSRSIQQLQDGILNLPAKRAQEAQERAAELMQTTNAMVAPGMHLEEFEINDYPQIARQKISHREPLREIEELTGAKVWVKGQYFADNAKMPDGARKLYVEMIGPTAISVQKAKNEVHKMMEALAIRTLNIPGVSRAVMGTPGRYDPAVGK